MARIKTACILRVMDLVQTLPRKRKMKTAVPRTTWVRRAQGTVWRARRMRGFSGI